ESALLPGPRLTERLEHTAEMNRDQHQVEGVHTEHVARAVAAAAQISSIQGEVRQRRQGKPADSRAVVEGEREEEEQAGVRDGQRDQIVTLHEAFPDGGGPAPPARQIADELRQDEQPTICPATPLDEERA